MSGKGPLESMLCENLIDIASSENLEIPPETAAHIFQAMNENPGEAHLFGLAKHVIILLREISSVYPSTSATQIPQFNTDLGVDVPPEQQESSPSHSHFSSTRASDDDTGPSPKEPCLSLRAEPQFPRFFRNPNSPLRTIDYYQDNHTGSNRNCSMKEWPLFCDPSELPPIPMEENKWFFVRGTEPTPPPTPPPTEHNIRSRAKQPLLKNNRCPFCSHHFSTGIPTIKTLFTHFSRSNHYEKIKGSFFACTACPEYKWRSLRCTVHLDFEKCGGSIIFKHDPKFTELDGIRQNKMLKVLRRKSGAYSGPNGSLTTAPTQPTTSKVVPKTTNVKKAVPVQNGARTLRSSVSAAASSSKKDEEPSNGRVSNGVMMRSNDSRYFTGEDRLRLHGMDTCPFCEHAFMTNDISCVTLYKHIRTRHPVNCAIFSCSNCPDLHFATADPVVNHYKKTTCKGHVTFNHCPEIPGMFRVGPADDGDDSANFGATVTVRIGKPIELQAKKPQPNQYTKKQPLAGYQNKPNNNQLNRNSKPKPHAEPKKTQPNQYTKVQPNNENKTVVQTKNDVEQRYLLNLSKCPFCEKDFLTRNMSAFSFDKHMQTTHSDVRGTMYRCSVCTSYVVRSATSMKAHFSTKHCKGFTKLDYRAETAPSKRNDSREDRENKRKHSDGAVLDDSAKTRRSSRLAAGPVSSGATTSKEEHQERVNKSNPMPLRESSSARPKRH